MTAEFAVTPYGTDGIGTVLATHGVAQPNCAGVFGGFPGGGSGYEYVAGSDLFDRLAASDPPADVDALTGDARVLAAKMPLFPMVPGDVINIIPQGGGGFGDPLERDPADVARDVADGLISEAVALAVYGVAAGASEEATEQERARLRRSRLAAASPPVNPASAPPSVTSARPCGDALELAVTAAGLHFRCRSCGHPLGPASANWKLAACRLALGADANGTGMQLDPRMAMTAFVCPSCAHTFDVEVHRAGDPPRHDMAIERIGEVTA